MVFSIKHESIITLMAFILSFVLFGGLSFVFIVLELSFVCIFLIFLQIIAIVMFLLFNTKPTTVTVEYDTINIRFPIMSETVNISDISDIRIERYERWHKNHYLEKRLKMIMQLHNGSYVILNDTAMSNFGGLQTLLSKELPDDEIELFNLYEFIKEKLN